MNAINPVTNLSETSDDNATPSKSDLNQIPTRTRQSRAIARFQSPLQLTTLATSRTELCISLEENRGGQCIGAVVNLREVHGSGRSRRKVCRNKRVRKFHLLN